MSNRTVRSIVVIIILAMMMSACNSENGDKPKERRELESVTMTLGTEYTQYLLQMIDFPRLVQEKYPHITLVLKEINTMQGPLPNDLDMVAGLSGFASRYMNMALSSDLTTWVPKYNFDLTRLKDSELTNLKAGSPPDTIGFLPYTSGLSALYFNKGIFDQLHIEYPRDGMIWNEVVQLANEITRSSGDNHYVGLPVFMITMLAQQSGLNPVDPITDKASLEDWRSLFELYEEVVNQPGYTLRPEANPAETELMFYRDQTVAMYLGQHTSLPILQQNSKLDWDLVSFPLMEGGAAIQPGSQGYGVFITEGSQHKEEAFLVASYLLSDEIQTLMTKTGVISALNSSEIDSHFAEDMPSVQDKNLSAFFKYPSRVIPYKYPVGGLINLHAQDIARGKDIDTVISETEQAINQWIAEEKMK